MNTVQLIAMVVFIVAMVAVYGRPLLALLPAYAIPESKTELMDHIEEVVNIRNKYRQPEVTEACNNLLRVLLGVKQ